MSTVAAFDKQWLPNPGPQTEAYFSKANLLLYGGAAGGGKTDLLLGLALNEHRNSVIFRRAYTDLRGVEKRLIAIRGSRDGYNGADMVLNANGRFLEFGALEKPGAELSWQGRDHDLIGFDEGAQLSEYKVSFVMGWLRSVDPKQRTRVVIASNPPIGSEGDWLMEWFAPWLDDNFHNPAAPGELRWAVTQNDGRTRWVGGPGIHEVDGHQLEALSRSFIPAFLNDNPFLKDTNYRAELQRLPEPLRSKLIDGDFTAGRKDADFQVIPTAWIVAAQNRWTRAVPEGFAMTAIGGDVSFGGDTTQLAPRYGGWFAPLVSIVGEDTKDGSLVAARIVQIRRDRCSVVVDMGGGYGGAVSLRLADNGIEPIPFNGANSSVERANDGSNLQFANKRAEAHWRLREALDPNQEGGSIIALPPDAELKADLAAPTWKLTPRGILVESKEDIRKRIGRSPDKGDAVVMCWSEGQAAQRLKGMPMPSMANRGYGDMKNGFGGTRGAFPSRANVGTKRLS